MSEWVDPGPQPRLVCRRCNRCGTSHFPPTVLTCRNPTCQSSDLADQALSGSGILWSYTVNRFRPPPPYPAADPFKPYGIAAVELADEGLVILGKVASDVDPAGLRVGMPMELSLEEDDHEGCWRWRPCATSTSVARDA